MVGKKGAAGDRKNDPGKPSLASVESRTGQNAFDYWLRRRLHQIFDSAVKEDIPADLQRLVQQLEERERSSRK